MIAIAVKLFVILAIRNFDESKDGGFPLRVEGDEGDTETFPRLPWNTTSP
jgi:hypothetical protein